MDDTLKRPAAAVVTSEAPPRKRPAPPLKRLAPWIVGLAALVMGLIRLGAPSLWMDEAFSVQLARQPLAVLLASYTTGSEPNMIAYHLLLHGWLALGTALGIPATEVFVRLPSVVFAALAAAALYTLGARFLGRTPALVAAIVYVASGWQLTYAQEARGYALQLALVVVSWLALFEAASAPRPRFLWWAVFVVAGALAVYVQALSALALLAQGLTVGVWLMWPSAWRQRARRSLPFALASFLAIGLLITPFALASRHGSKTGWLPAPTPAALSAHLSKLVAQHSKLLEIAVAVGLIALVALAVWWMTMGRRMRLVYPAAFYVDGGALTGDVWPVALGLALWIVVVTVVSYVISLGPTRVFSSRYLIIVLPALCLLLGAAVAALPLPAARLWTVGLIAVVMLALAPSYYAHAQVEDWRTPVHWLERAYQPGDGLVSYNNVQGCELPVDYYLQTDGSAAHFDVNSPGAIHWARYGHGDPFSGFSAATDPQALAQYAAQHPRMFFIEGRFTNAADEAKAHRAQAWLDAHYHLIGQTSSAVVTIRLYDTRG